MNPNLMAKSPVASHVWCSGIRRQLAGTAAAAQEIVMKKVIGIVAVVLSLLGTANFTLAQASPDMNVTTGSATNGAAKAHQGEYLGGQ
jgi:hypothetical protein